MKNIPRLRFPTFSDEWEKMRFSDFISYTKGFAFKSKDYQNDGVRIVRVSDLGYDSIKSSHGIYLDKSKVHSVEKYVIDEGDIIITTVGSRPELIDSSVGRGILVRKNGEGLLNQNLVKINKCEKIKNKFLFGFFNTKKYFNYITQIQRGNANQSNITLKEFFNYQVSIPSLPEQQKIADFLTAVNKRIELLEKKKTLLETYKKGVMKKIFNQEIRFKDDNGNDFPDWEEYILNELGGTLNGLTGKTKDDFDKGSCKYIQYKQVFGDSKIDPNGFGLVDVGETEKQTEMKYGDILFTTSSETPNEIGMSSVFMSEIQNVYLNSFCFGFRPKSLENLIPNFSRFLFRSEKVRSSIVKLAQGSTRFNMSKTNFLKIRVRIPSTDEQVKISEFLSSIDDQIELLDTQIDKSKTWKKGLLQKMFV
ncbi:restriction endonuclease subunit S [Pseudotenacibaculum sp. MALMAid0570]|uniref:restriction endonuclease subunit S n=1 Tax=Pseudotenacibaculum sp. MALMAid0570 TaxID=3143938 RepID=UPI0032DEF0DF